MAKAIFALEDGSYSDYHVIGIYTTRERAETVQKLVGGDINEWTLDPGWTEINTGLNRWRVWMLRDGTVEETFHEKITGYWINEESMAWIWRRTQALAYKDKGIPDCLQCLVWAKNEKHAVKIANEKRAQMIAEGKWD